MSGIWTVHPSHRNPIDIDFPTGWGSVSNRSVAGRVDYEIENKARQIENREAKCIDVRYASTYRRVSEGKVWEILG
jgi:hypothetical protein